MARSSRLCYDEVMIKQFLLSMVLSSGFAASLAVPAFAQDNPNTTQTDQSEEDWRKSKKKTTTDDPWDGFKNTNGWGQGTQRSLSPVDTLPEDSRRFLMKERAQRMAEAGIGEPVDTSFEPSDAAKSDPSLESDEKAAWTEMMKDIGGSGTPTQGDPSGDPNADPSQGSNAPQIPTQVGETGSSAGSSGAATSSVMRGGSSASVSDILSQLKGGGAAPAGQALGQQGQAQQGQSQSSQGQAQAQNQNQGQAQAQAQAQAQNTAQNAAQGQLQQSGDAQSNADAQAQAQAAADAAATRTPEAISPLDRLKQVRQDRDSNGARSSASDYLNRGN